MSKQSMVQRLYLDTSVVSALGDKRAPDRVMLTAEFFARRNEFELFASDLTHQEIMDTGDPARREGMLRILEGISIIPTSEEARRLGRHYVDAGVFPASVAADALHVAIAVLERFDAIISWNFKHLVNQRRRAALNATNLSLGLPQIAILPPPEV